MRCGPPFSAHRLKRYQGNVVLHFLVNARKRYPGNVCGDLGEKMPSKNSRKITSNVTLVTFEAIWGTRFTMISKNPTTLQRNVALVTFRAIWEFPLKYFSASLQRNVTRVTFRCKVAENTFRGSFQTAPNVTIVTFRCKVVESLNSIVN